MKKSLLLISLGIGCSILGTAVVTSSVRLSAKPSQGALAAQKIVALTFDDGPSAQYTPQILDILKQTDVHATFFVIGSNVSKHPEIVKREVKEGNAVGNHTWSHPLFAPIESGQRLCNEITRTDSAIYGAAGLHVSLFRPPHGWCTPWMKKRVEGMGYNVVNWTVDPEDWKHPKTESIVDRVDKSLGVSAIVLFHDGLELRNDPCQENTVRALRMIIENFKAKGYLFVTVPQMIGDPNFAQKYPALFNVIGEAKKTTS